MVLLRAPTAAPTIAPILQQTTSIADLISTLVVATEAEVISRATRVDELGELPLTLVGVLELLLDGLHSTLSYELFGEGVLGFHSIDYFAAYLIRMRRSGTQRWF